MLEIDRTAIVLKPTQLMLNWILTVEPALQTTLTLEILRKNCSMFLLPAFEDDDEVWECIEQLAPELFGCELASWDGDTNKWPTPLDYATFTQWFDVEFHSTIIDLVAESEYDDEFDDEDDDDSEDDVFTHELPPTKN